MVIVKVLGFMDLLTAVTIVLMHYNFPVLRLGLIFACYLFFKSFVFMGDIGSVIDFLAAVYLVLMMIFHLHIFLAFVFSGYLLEKAILSFL